ncbi:MAG: MaoC/PaaZ C-terminal domain-containing protein [Bacillota bacterium]|uniref:MaoC/PaaZ C-terminal domain-containing protein n=1 Tax=Bacillus sp. RO2 TaxID=2723913 RepID=UPI00145DDA90|nr:MaoC/PaaZ C-terminal domain-containing protein [Bacillus sp. RO2]MEA3322319.1 MaoC/PaaZ C-terminal domain-containing protein [Bacillota bacterium]NMH73349.1 enoyl-CoA hydratase [Bacillus sp. RO2]
MKVETGEVLTYSRTFTVEEILQFGEVSGDQGRHHVEKDEHGRLMVHGLLTASIGTKIGGDLNYIAREMNMEFLRPVFTGDTITCVATLTNVQQQEDYKQVNVTSIYTNQNGKQVLIGNSKGIIRD